MIELLHDTNIWVAFSFVLFVALMIKAAKPVILTILDTHIAQVKKEITTAETLRNEAQALLDQYQAKQRDALAESEKLLANAKAQAISLQQQAEQELTETMARREVMLQERLKRMEVQAIEEIQRYAADLALKATTQIIVEKMDQSTAQRLIDSSIQKVSGSLAA